MRRRLLALTIVLTLGSLALAAATNASSAGAVTVSGAYSISDLGTTTCAPVGSSAFMFRCDTDGLVSQYSGDLAGTAVADFTSLINCATSTENGHGQETFTGTLAGFGAGMLVWADQFSADVDCSFAPDFFIPFNFDISSVAVKGSEGFAGLQGKLAFTDTTYSGRFQ